MNEWIVTNGLGSYASLTTINQNTRKFHGLLIASLEPPTKRWMFVSNVFDTIKNDEAVYDLQKHESRFVFNLFPSIEYNLPKLKVKKTFCMPHESNTTILQYEITTKKPAQFIHSPLVTSKHFYDMLHPDAVSLQQTDIPNGIHLKPDNSDKEVKIIVPDARYDHAESWIQLIYDTDRERNDSHIDHAVQIGSFTKAIYNTCTYYILLTIENKVPRDPAKLFEKEIQRKKQLLKQANLPNHFDNLVLATDDFVVKKGPGKSIIAGYHWFGDWGRDTLIALPGITLIPHRFEEAKQILHSFSTYCKNGLIPNAFMDRDSVAVYNTVDASLWYVDRVYQYLKYTNDHEFLESIYPTLQSIINGYQHGTEFDIHMDSDFLISHAEGLTWMDVKIGDYYPTPRATKAVETQALWYNALMIMGGLAEVLGRDDSYSSLADQVKESFNRQYDFQYDVVDTRDLTVRPNQIFLVSLDFSMIPQRLQKTIVQEVQDQLVTPVGLRTLSPVDPRYKGRYLGEYHRDEAYHNGTVWPWLMGPFITAFMKTKNHTKQWREYAYEHFLQPMLTTLGDHWDGSIPEIYDGDPPHYPRGCITQAWSVAEVLRTWVEDIQGVIPQYEKTFLLHEVGV